MESHKDYIYPCLISDNDAICQQEKCPMFKKHWKEDKDASSK